MKVFLLYPDRDLDPEQTVPPNTADLVQDLELNTLFAAMAQEDRFIFDVVKQVILSSLDGLEVIRYRQEMVKDCLAHPDIIRQIYQIAVQARERKRGQWLGIFSTTPSGILGGALQMLQTYVELLKLLKHLADEHAATFKSAAFRRFFAMIQQELDDNYFVLVEEHLNRLRFRGGVLLSARLGKGNAGTGYVLRKSEYDDQNWIERVWSQVSPAYSFTLHPRDDGGARELEDIRNHGLNLAANAVAQSADHIDSFFHMLRLELAFCVGCVNLAEQLTQMGEPITFPDLSPANARRHAFRGLYDVALALTMQRKVVGNNVSADGKDLVIITGANQGGKSTFLRSIGLAQMMMQGGMFVAAETFAANLCHGMYTHYKREEDATMKHGKFDEELARMSAIVDTITPGSLILFNESFASTNEREGAEIARQIVDALLARGIKVFYVTHMYELAYGFYADKRDRTLFLRATREVDGRRTFKLQEGEPLPTSFGLDLYNRIFGEDKTPAQPETSPVFAG